MPTPDFLEDILAFLYATREELNPEDDVLNQEGDEEVDDDNEEDNDEDE
jgi:hypothetical protein